MQRWIAVAVVAMILMLGGGGFAYWNYKQNRPAPMWVPLPFNPDSRDDEREKAARDLKAKLDSPMILIRISKDLDLTRKWDLPSDDAAAGEISKRLFVKVGEADSPMGRVPSINIGVEGKVRDMNESGEIAKRLVQEALKILGIKPPASK